MRIVKGDAAVLQVDTGGFYIRKRSLYGGRIWGNRMFGSEIPKGGDRFDGYVDVYKRQDVYREPSVRLP